MKLLLEGRAYKKSFLETVFKNHQDFLTPKGGSKTDAIPVGVGYFYSKDDNEHYFILPKVFCYKQSSEKEQLFGEIDIPYNNAINVTDQTMLTLKKWEVDVLQEIPLMLYKGIERYRHRKQFNTIVSEDQYQSLISSRNDTGDATLLDVILSLVDYYNTNKDLFISTYKQSHRGFNKISWQKTIRKCQPIVNRNKVIYPIIVNQRKEINYDEKLLVIFFNTLKYIKEYGFRFQIEQPYNLYPENEFKRLAESGMILKELKNIKNNYYSDKFIELWNLLHRFYDKTDKRGNKKSLDDYLLVKDFNLVFEDMIDYLLGDDNSTYNTDHLKEQKDGKIIDHLFKYQSLFGEGKEIYYIGDSKYYKESTDLQGTSLDKQFTYATNMIQTQIDYQKKLSQKPLLRYRDELTMGYDITPNFFISGFVRSYYKKNEHRLSNRDENGELFIRHRNQWENCLFDRDTLFVIRYTINFMFVLNTYAIGISSKKTAFKFDAKDIIKKDFQTILSDRYDIMKVYPKNIGEFVDKHLKSLIGKIYHPSDECGYLVLAYEKDSTGRDKVIDTIREDCYKIE